MLNFRVKYSVFTCTSECIPHLCATFSSILINTTTSISAELFLKYICVAGDKSGQTEWPRVNHVKYFEETQRGISLKQKSEIEIEFFHKKEWQHEIVHAQIRNSTKFMLRFCDFTFQDSLLLRPFSEATFIPSNSFVEAIEIV